MLLQPKVMVDAARKPGQKHSKSRPQSMGSAIMPGQWWGERAGSRWAGLTQFPADLQVGELDCGHAGPWRPDGAAGVARHCSSTGSGVGSSIGWQLGNQAPRLQDSADHLPAGVPTHAGSIAARRRSQAAPLLPENQARRGCLWASLIPTGHCPSSQQATRRSSRLGRSASSSGRDLNLLKEAWGGAVGR